MSCTTSLQRSRSGRKKGKSVEAHDLLGIFAKEVAGQMELIKGTVASTAEALQGENRERGFPWYDLCVLMGNMEVSERKRQNGSTLPME